jgi:hypothetical protein
LLETIAMSNHASPPRRPAPRPTCVAPLARRPARAGRLALVAALALLGGCPFFGGDSGPPQPSLEMSCEDGPAPPGSAALQLGLGQDGPFTPLNGQAVPLFRGPQGGQHVFVTARLYASSGRYWPAELRLTDETGDPRGQNTEYLEACPGRWSVSRYLRVFLDNDNPIASATLKVSARPDEGMAAPLQAQARLGVIDP